MAVIREVRADGAAESVSRPSLDCLLRELVIRINVNGWGSFRSHLTTRLEGTNVLRIVYYTCYFNEL